MTTLPIAQNVTITPLAGRVGRVIGIAPGQLGKPVVYIVRYKVGAQGGPPNDRMESSVFFVDELVAI